MRIKQIITPAVMILASSASFADAVSEVQFDSIKKLGQLNGIALHCKYLGETRNMKKALIETLPKRRQLGKAFDDFTNVSFLDVIQKKSTCPEKEPFAVEVEVAIQGLKTAFKEK